MNAPIDCWPALSFLEGLRPGPEETVELAFLAAYSADLGSIGAATDPGVWAKVAARILGQREGYWPRCSSARILQVATTGSTRSLTSDSLLSDWLLKLREKPCLPDTRNVVRVPSELLRRTSETESLIDVEPFVYGLLDRGIDAPDP